jgi:hypothetical protein
MINCILLFLLLLITPALLKGQCSDAGVCGLFSDTQSDKTAYVFGLSQYFGIGDNNTGVFITNLSFEYKSQEIDISVNAPYVYTNGDLGYLSGIGDLMLTAAYTSKLEGDFLLTYAFGVKFPTGDDNGKKSGIPLPMVYQTGGGTFDIMLGAALDYQGWRLSAGWQNPLGENSNSFLHEKWAGRPEARDYAESRELDRGMDIVLSLEKSFDIDGTSIYGGVIGIFRITDSYYRPSESGILDKRLADKAGSTVNLKLGINDKLNNYAVIFVEAAMPVVVRQTAADGLKRAFTGILGLRFIL